KLLEIVRARRTRIGYPHIAVSIDVDAMRPHEHPSAETPDLFPRLIEMVNRVRFGAETAGCRSRRASIGRPHRLAIAVDGHAVRATPGPSLGLEPRPVTNDAAPVGAAVDGLDFIRLRRASALLRLHGSTE